MTLQLVDFRICELQEYLLLGAKAGLSALYFHSRMRAPKVLLYTIAESSNESGIGETFGSETTYVSMT